MDLPTSKNDMYLWFIALIVMHIICILLFYFLIYLDVLLNIIVISLKSYHTPVSVYYLYI